MSDAGRAAGGVAPHGTALQVARRLPQLIAGLWIFGMGLGFVVLGGQGQGPWVVFDEGVSRHTPLTIGTVAILVGLVLIVGLVGAREPVGFGTLANAVVVGLSTRAGNALERLRPLPRIPASRAKSFTTGTLRAEVATT